MLLLKHLLFWCIVTATAINVAAQTDAVKIGLPIPKDSTVVKPPDLIIRDSNKAAWPVKKSDTVLNRSLKSARPLTNGATILPTQVVAGAPDIQINTDTLTVVATDTVAVLQSTRPVFTRTDSLYKVFLTNPFLPMLKKPVYQIVKIKSSNRKDELFYLSTALVFFLGAIKLVFAKYYSNLFSIFFQPSFRQKQTREQLMQSNLPSLLLNVFFVLSSATYLSLTIKYFGLISFGFWKVLLYTTIVLAVLYSAKFIFLSFSGWVFNAREAAGTYMFVVFLINKIIGIVLLPFILVIAFSKPAISSSAITLSFIVLFILFLYRYIISYSPVVREVKVKPFHFAVYIVAIEILPLLFIYKSLILYMDRTL